MLRAAIVAIVGFSARRPWVVIALALTLAAASAAYSVRHFAIKTDVTDLFPADLPWTAREPSMRLTSATGASTSL